MTTELHDDASGRLIVGLDVPTIAEAEKVVEELGNAVSFYKIGYQLVFAGGLDFAKSLVAARKSLPRHEAARYRQHDCQRRGKCREDGCFHAHASVPIRRQCVRRWKPPEGRTYAFWA